RTEPFFTSASHWIKSVYEMRGMGETFFKTFLSKRITTVQGSLALAMMTRIALGGQSPGEAFRGFYYFWIAGPTLYAWPWVPAQAGNSIEEGRIASKLVPFNEQKVELAVALKRGDMAELRASLES